MTINYSPFTQQQYEELVAALVTNAEGHIPVARQPKNDQKITIGTDIRPIAAIACSSGKRRDQPHRGGKETCCGPSMLRRPMLWTCRSPRSGNRAEAWYQIRYETNKNKDLASRCYYESDQFNPMSQPWGLQTRSGRLRAKS